MEKLFSKITPKDWLYIAGAVASLIALYMLFGKNSITTPNNGTITDAPADTLAPLVTSPSPGYTTYNTGPIVPTPLTTASPDETAAGPCGCSSPTAMGCAGPSQLDNGGAYSSNQQLYSFLDSISPQYAALQAQQLQTYNEYFATGSTYSSGAGTITGTSAVAVNAGSSPYSIGEGAGGTPSGLG